MLRVLLVEIYHRFSRLFFHLRVGPLQMFVIIRKILMDGLEGLLGL